MFIPSIGKRWIILCRLKIGNKTETEILINRNSFEEGLNLFRTIVEIDVKIRLVALK